MFNFEIDSKTVQQSSASSSKVLKGGQIHRVKLQEVKEEQIKVKARKATDNLPARDEYTDTVLTIVVANEEGETYTERFFTPNKDMAERRTNDKGNLQPSAFEQLQNRITQYLIAFRPKLMQDIQEGKQSFKAKDWAGFRSLVLKALTKAVNKSEAFLKLLKNNQGYAETPRYPAAMGKDRETGAPQVFTGSTFIHHDQSLVEFSAFEISRLQTLASAKPTNVDSIAGSSDLDDVDPDLDDSDLEFDDLSDDDLSL